MKQCISRYDLNRWEQQGTCIFALRKTLSHRCNFEKHLQQTKEKKKQSCYIGQGLKLQRQPIKAMCTISQDTLYLQSGATTTLWYDWIKSVFDSSYSDFQAKV